MVPSRGYFYRSILRYYDRQPGYTYGYYRIISWTQFPSL